jgi:hypothetical protein
LPSRVVRRNGKLCAATILSSGLAVGARPHPKTNPGAGVRPGPGLGSGPGPGRGREGQPRRGHVSLTGPERGRGRSYAAMRPPRLPAGRRRMAESAIPSLAHIIHRARPGPRRRWRRTRHRGMPRPLEFVHCRGGRCRSRRGWAPSRRDWECPRPSAYPSASSGLARSVRAQPKRVAARSVAICARGIGWVHACPNPPGAGCARPIDYGRPGRPHPTRARTSDGPCVPDRQPAPVHRRRERT